MIDSDDMINANLDEITQLKSDLARIKLILTDYLSHPSLDGKPVRQEYRAVLAKLIK